MQMKNYKEMGLVMVVKADGGYQILLERNYEPSWDMAVASYV
jgi:hypothetical protein